jgi:general secretion pathway protein I
MRGSGIRDGGMRHQRGFTLLEVIVALIIAGLAAVALMQSAGTGLRTTRTASMVDQAIVRARSRLTAATHGSRLIPGDTNGDDGGGFRWRLRIVPVAGAAVRPLIVGPRAASSVPVTLYGISVWIAWNEGGREHAVRLDTEQVGG